MAFSQNNKGKDNTQSDSRNQFIKSLGPKNLKNISIKNFTKTQKELKDEWLWLNKKKLTQPPIRDEKGKIKVISSIKDLTPDDVWQMSQAQLLASWKLSTGILENKLELVTERCKVTDTLVEKYKRDLNTSKTNTTNNLSEKSTSSSSETEESLKIKIFDINQKLTNLTDLVQTLITTGNTQNNPTSNSETPNS